MRAEASEDETELHSRPYVGKKPSALVGSVAAGLLAE
jgi:hypothetical protein